MLAFFAMLAITASAIQVAARPDQKAVRIPLVVWPFVVLILTAAFQTSIGFIGFTGDFVVVAFYLCMGVAALTAGYNTARCKETEAQGRPALSMHLELLSAAVLVGAVGSVILALVQAFGVWDEAGWINRTFAYRRPGANMSQANHLATLAIMGMASLVYLHEVRKIAGGAVLSLLLVLLLGVAVTESRTGVLGCGALAMWWYVHRSRIGFMAPKWGLTLAALAFSGFYWAWPKFLEFVQEGGGATFASASVGINLSSGARTVVWPQLLDAIWQRPLLGWGLNEVPAAINAVLHNYREGYPFTYAHNLVLDLWVGVGVPLALALVLAVVTWLWNQVRHTQTLTQWYGLAMVLPLAIHSMLEFPFAYAYFSLPVLYLAGMLEGLAAPDRNLRAPWQLAAAGVVVLTAGLIWSASEYFALEEDYRVVRLENLKVGTTRPDYVRPTTHILTQLAALTEVARMKPTPGMSAESVELMRKVAMRYPAYASQNRYALALALNGNPQEAVRQLKVMQAMHGEASFAGIRAYWIDLSQHQYPQLSSLALP
jgi:O-antigen ligase